MRTSRQLMHLSRRPFFNTKAVVQETDVPADTFRAWERRYGIPLPQRSEGGHRLYSEYDIGLIVWLRDRTAEGLTISQAVALLQEETHEPLESHFEQSPSHILSLSKLSTALTDALISFQGQQAEQILGQALALYPVEDICIELIQPSLIEIGDRWHQSTLSVTQEHYASQFVRRKLDALLHSYTQQQASATVVVGCAPNELHELGALILAIFLARANWRVIYLGQSVPYQGLLHCLQHVQAQLLCLSAASKETALQLKQLGDKLSSDLPELRFAYGGLAFNGDPQLRQTMPGVFLGEDARQAIDAVQALFGTAIEMP